MIAPEMGKVEGGSGESARPIAFSTPRPSLSTLLGNHPYALSLPHN